MTQPAQQSPVSLEKAWGRLMQNMGRTNIARAGNARKAANMLHRVRTKR